MKKAIIYHKADLDGIGSAAIAFLASDSEAKLYPADYEDEPYKVEDFKDKMVVIVDFCPKEIEAIKEVSSSFCWIDHHKTAKERHPKLWKDKKVLGNRSLTHSAIYLTYIYFNGKEDIPDAVKYIEDYDMWWFKNEDKTKAFCEYAHMHLKDPKDGDWIYLLANNKDITDVLRRNGQILLQAKQNRIGKTIAHITEKQWGKHKVGIVNTNHDLSNVGNAIVEQGYDIGVVWRYVDGKILVGFRSLKVDVSEIAKQYGGGGHKLASGCTIDFKTLMEWLA